MQKIIVKGVEYLFDDEVPFDFNEYTPYLGSVANKSVGIRYLRGRHKETGKTVAFSRLILGLERGEKLYADHINRDVRDNRRQNLRIVTPSQSNMNRITQKGKYRNLWWQEKRQFWVVQIEKDKKLYGFGCYKDKGEARRAAEKGRKELFGEYCPVI